MTQPHLIVRNLLASLESELKKNNSVLAVFDLDSTLFDVSPRTQKILDNLRNLPEIQKKFPDLLPHLQDVKTRRTDWGIKSALMRAFENKTPPPVEFNHAARDFWAQHFFSNEYLHFDHPVEGAVDFVNTLFKLGAQITYLTGRDWPRMGPGTLEVLKKWNFPYPDQSLQENPVQLIMKPQAGSDDSDFKSGWFENLKPHDFSRILFFENEPKILHSVESHHPEVEIFFLQTTHSGKAEPLGNLTHLPYFFKG